MQKPEISFDDIYASWLDPWWCRPTVLLMLFFTVFLLFVVFYIIRRALKRRGARQCPYKSLISALEALQNDTLITEHDYAVQLGSELRAFVSKTEGADCRSYTETEFSQLLERCAYSGSLRECLKEACVWSVCPKFCPNRQDAFGDRDLRIARLIDELRLSAARLNEKK